MRRVGIPIFSPALPLRRMPGEAVGRCALYTGESAARMRDVVSASLARER
jgi:hypothetical protein